MNAINARWATTYLIILCFNCCADKQVQHTGLEGKPLPSFKLLLPDSVNYFDTKDLPISKPTVLFYFSDHCPYSHTQMQEIIEHIQSLKNINFCIFTSPPFSKTENFYSRYHLDKYPNIIIGMDYTYFFPYYFKTRKVPYIAIYNKNKLLSQAFLGEINSKKIKSLAEQQ